MSDMAVNPNATAVWSTLPAAPAAPAAAPAAPAAAAAPGGSAPAGDSSSVSGASRLYTEIWNGDIGKPSTAIPQKPAVEQAGWADPPVTERWNGEITFPDPPKPPIEGASFRSWGDPHEVSGDGLKYDNMLTGTFTAFKSASGDLELQKFQEKDEAGRWAGATLNKAAGIKVGDNAISYDIRNDQLMVNGQQVSTRPGSSFQLPDGGSVSVGTDGNISVNSALGDTITIKKNDGYIDFEGSLAAGRPDGSVFGSLGTFDADTDPANDLKRPDGSVFPITYNANKSANNQVMEGQAHVDQFLELWRVPTAMDLIPTR